ncbi:MAG: methyltransferase [Bacteriovoracaceae bacterium]|jgi:ribosomal protein L11 methyltransferase|nr:methyltransferase [Bacteriovoracaceae bacterium]
MENTKQYAEVVIDFHGHYGQLKSSVQDIAFSEYGCQGSCEYSMDEPEVDEILGERSYSGGDLPLDVIEEVESKVLGSSEFRVGYFYNENEYLERASAFVNKLEKKFPEITASLTLKEEKDWNTEWRKSYGKIVIDDELSIIPSWEKETLKRDELYIYPGQGFGTGSHETTFLCLEAFCKLIVDLDGAPCVLDFGCGSGILGIAALKKKIKNVQFFDIDDEALENCHQNIELNEMHCLGGFVVTKNKRDLDQKFDLVFANILLDILTDEHNFLLEKTKPGGILIVSGILKCQKEELIQFYTKDSGFEELFYSEKNDWGMVVFKRV